MAVFFVPLKDLLAVLLMNMNVLKVVVLIYYWIVYSDRKKSESLQTEGRHFRSMICKINDV